MCKRCRIDDHYCRVSCSTIFCHRIKFFINIITEKYTDFLTCSADFWITILFSNFNYDCSNVLDLINLQEQVKKAVCYQKFFWPFTVWINCSSDLKKFANSWPSASNFKSFSRSLEQFFLTVGQNNFGNKIPLLEPKEVVA